LRIYFFIFKTANFIILLKDGDVFYLRDLRMLFMFDFIYKWSYTDQYNTAIIGIRKQKNPSMVNFYGKAVLSSHSVEGFASYFHPFAVTNHGPGSEGVNIYDYKGLKLLHSSMLDPVIFILTRF
jgi:hypothetical protein